MPQAHFRIVAQKLLELVRKASFRRWALALVLPFAGVVTAFGIAPDTIIERIEQSRVVEDVLLALPTLPPTGAGSASAPDKTQPQTQTFWHEERIQRGDTQASLLARLGIEDAEAENYLRSARDVRSLHQLVPGRAISAETTADGQLVTLRYLNGNTLMTITRSGDVFTAKEETAQLETRVLTAAGDIRSSLFAATDRLNVPDSIVLQMVDVFSTDVDFHKDLRKNDRFAIVYEMHYDRGEPVRSGRLLSAEFVNQGKTLTAVWFAPGGDTPDAGGSYYTLDGKNIRKAFLRSPLEFSRITSGFTAARYHPILQTWRAHTGVDFAAPIGTRIKATADGVVEFAGAQGGYGNVVILRHPNKITTLYAHMAGFAQGIHKGARVQQGDVIGTVGMTGLTTGPHVHYEFRVDNVHRDPLSVAVPVAFPIAPEFKQQFLQAAAPHARTIATLRGAAPSTFE
jgi:murein DD-endopeptidase MepM/ murein hydrolase activator NlpD